MAIQKKSLKSVSKSEKNTKSGDRASIKGPRDSRGTKTVNLRKSSELLPAVQ